MAAAFGWGTLAASSLAIGAIIAVLFRISLRMIGMIMAFGAGVLISAVSFDLVEEAVGKSSGHGWVVAGVFAGCGVFFGGDLLIDRIGGGQRKDADGGQRGGSALGIVLGSVLDGIPESMVIGLTIYEGGAVGAAYLAAVFISNLPESISSTAGLVTGGWKQSRILWMWIAIALISGLASLAGYGLFQNASPDVVAFVLAFAAGAILTMLSDTMMPEAYEHGGKWVGVVTTLGFAVAFTIQRSTELGTGVTASHATRRAIHGSWVVSPTSSSTRRRVSCPASLSTGSTTGCSSQMPATSSGESARRSAGLRAQAPPARRPTRRADRREPVLSDRKFSRQRLRGRRYEQRRLQGCPIYG